MSEFPPLDTFGNRIMICGPSNAGKSTLAVALGKKLHIPHVHLDQLYHVPDSNWVPRPREEFVALHNEAIKADSWVMDGNYSGLFPGRLARATGIIVIRSNRFTGFVRYLNRTLLQRERAGSLSGNRDSLKWQMVHWILIAAPPKQKAMRAAFPSTGLPYIEVRAMAQLNRLYAEWGLSRK